MTTATDFPDWTQPVGIIDQAALVSAPNQDIPAYPASVEYDTSRVATLILRILIPEEPAPGTYAVIAQWSEAGTDTTNDVITFPGAPGPVGEYFPMMVTLPVRGSAVQLSVVGTDSRPVGVQAYTSTRAVSGPQCRSGRSTSGAFITDTGYVNVPASSSVQLASLLPVGSKLGITVSTNSPEVYVNAAATVLSGGAIATGNLGYFVIPSGSPINGIATTTVPAPLCATQWTATNTDTAAHLARLAVYDLS